ncbi:methyl-accepting chemotaxis protein [soil metagenome]
MKLSLSGASIGARIRYIIVIALLGNALIIGVGMVGLQRVEDHLARLVNVNTVKSDAVAGMRFAILARVDRVRNIALTPEVNKMTADQEAIARLIKDFAAAMASIESLPRSEQEIALLDAVRSQAEKAEGFMKKAQSLARMLNTEQSAMVLTDDLAPVQAELIGALDKLAAIATTERSATLAEASSNRQGAMLAMGVVGVLSMVVCLVAATMLSRGIVRRLALGSSVVRRIADGDLSGAVDISGNDEISGLLGSVDGMRGRLQDALSKIRRSAETISTATSEIAIGNQDLSVRTEQQAANLEQTAASMQHMASSIANNAESAQAANQQASGASEVAVRGSDAVGRVVAMMGDIQTNAKRIGDIIGVIDGIAFQTNILALNAAVEAARAGEQGRGFAVVASEVRSLAQRSATAAKDIKSLITTSIENVDVGVRLVGDSGTTMQEIVDRVGRVSALVAQITLSGANQSEGIGQINSAVGQLDEMTQRNAALVEQSTAASDSLKSEATSLVDAISVFKLT